MPIFQVPVKGEVTVNVEGLPLVLDAEIRVTIRANDDEDAAISTLDALKASPHCEPIWHVDLDNVKEVNDADV